MRPRSFAVITVFVLPCALLLAQGGEVTTKESTVTFRSISNLVSVPVVVRDSKGVAIGTLGRDDFQLFDNGKLQSISKFTVERIAPVDPRVTPKSAPTPAAGQILTAASADGIPNRFVAFLFDDLHMKSADLVYLREAAKRQIDKLHPLERAAIYTTSGKYMSDFMGDREKLRAAIDGVHLGDGEASRAMQQNICPSMGDYEAYLIEEKNDEEAFGVAVKDAGKCMDLAGDASYAESAARRAAKAVDGINAQNAQTAFDTVRAILNKMSEMPGQRSLVLVSPGFLVADYRLEMETQIINRAIKANIVIGALDGRGLDARPPGGDASVPGTTNLDTLTLRTRFEKTGSFTQSGVLGTLAAGTGGTFFENSNDFDTGFERTAAAPEYIYVLGFSPQEMKLNGALHNLKVSLLNGKGLQVQARKAYYAPNSAIDPGEQARHDMDEAFFSLDEIHDLPATLQTQYFRLDTGESTLSAVATIDAKKLSYKKDGDRNRNIVTIHTGLFDDDGNFVSGLEKVVTLALLDQTLEKRLGSGLPIKSSFTVRPGKYIIRMVVRDAEGGTLAAQSTRVEVP